MGRKVFFSVLGTGFYGSCKYIYNDKVLEETRFIQAAMLEAYNMETDWTKEDKICILLTNRARTNNWEFTGKRPKDKDSEPEEYQGLKYLLEEKHLKATICPLDIPDGRDESEMWQIFDVLFSIIEEGDELYFDLTHSFRYLPMLVLVFGNYAKYMKGTHVIAMTYGNYEARNEKEEAPIVDLMPLSALQDFTEGAASFKKFGKMGDLTELISSASKGNFFGLSKKATNRYKDQLKFLVKSIDELERQLSTCRGKLLDEGTAATDVKTGVANVHNGKLPQPLRLLLERLGTQISPLVDNKNEQRLKATINWCASYGMTQQAYTLAQESLITILCKRFEKELVDMKHLDQRSFISSLLGARSLQDESTWKGMLVSNPSLTRAFAQLPWLQELRKSYEILTSNRNQINHAGFMGKVSAKTIIDQFHTYFEKCFAIIETELEHPTIIMPTEKIFINFSNHPYSLWESKQREAAAVYGTCQDIPFPQVDPLADEEAIHKIAEKSVAEIYEQAQGKLATVHVMGEMSLAFAIVTSLKKLGLPCVASTTYRIVGENVDGSKQVIFCFERFRSY